jgi:hypothetical protein
MHAETTQSSGAHTRAFFFWLGFGATEDNNRQNGATTLKKKSAMKTSLEWHKMPDWSVFLCSFVSTPHLLGEDV